MYEEYMQDLLGYNMNLNRNGWENRDITDMTYDYRNMMYDTTNNTNIEQCYPEIYRIIYPMIQKACMKNTSPVTKEVIEQMTQEIYSNIETGDIINININLDGAVSNRLNSENDTKSKADEIQVENRITPNERNFMLNDLIRILLIRELLGREEFPNRPEMPGFPGGPNSRPPMRPSMRPRMYEII